MCKVCLFALHWIRLVTYRPISRSLAPRCSRALLPCQPRWQRCTAQAGTLVPAKSISSAFFNIFFSRATARSPQNAHAPLPGVAWCRCRWYISKLVCDGNSEKIWSWPGEVGVLAHLQPPRIRGSTRTCTRAWAGKTHILRGWTIFFSRSPCVF